MIDDRFTKGIISGITGALVQNILAFPAKLLGLTDTLYIDVAYAVLFNISYKGVLSVIVSLLGHLVIDAFWGVIFAFLIKYTSSKFYIFKGIVFGCSIWFLVRVIITKIFQLPVLSKNTPKTALFFFFGAAMFGLTIALVLKFLDDKKQNVNNQK
jgi:uncharacterized membrane protein YagU involved in acid resistance